MAAYVVDDPDTPPNFSLEIFDDPAGRKLHRLYAANALALRSTEPDVLVDAVEVMLATHEAGGSSLPIVQMAVVAGPAGAVLVPDGGQLGSSTGKPSGLVRYPIWNGTLGIDPATAEIVLPQLARRESTHADLAASRDDTIARPGRYPLRAVCYVGRGASDPQQVEGTDAVYTIAQILPVDDAEAAEQAVSTARSLLDRGVTVLAAPLSAINGLVDS